MITEKEFHDALETVIKYQFQISLLIQKSLNVSSKIQEDIKSKNKTLIMDFINSHEKISVRLTNILKFQSMNSVDEAPVKYVEDFNKKSFLRNRNAGNKSWNELCELMGKDPHSTN